MTSRWRRAGYRVFGRRFDYLLHMRPAEWPIMAAHAAVGYLLAVKLDGAMREVHLAEALAGLVVWVVALNGGTLALNSAFDRDEDDIAYLRAPPPPPPHLARWGLALMGGGLVVAALVGLPPLYLGAYALCVILSILYSMPPFRLKAVPGADWLINMWGFGAITPFAMWTVTGEPLDAAHGWTLFAFCPLFAALYPLTQLYQLEEDVRRGDRTFAGRLGPRRSVMVAVGAAVLAFGCLAAGAAEAEWRVSGADGYRWLALGVAAMAWGVVLLPWLARAETYAPRDHQRGMYRALVAWAVTDAAVIAAWGI